MKQLLLIFAFLAIQTFMFTTVTSQNVTSSFDLAVNSSFPVPTSTQNISLNSSLNPSILPPTSTQNISLNSSINPSINLSVGGNTTAAGNTSVTASSPAGNTSVTASSPAGNTSVTASSPAIASSSGLPASSSGGAASSSGPALSTTGSTSASQSNTPSGTATATGSRSSSRTGTNSKTQTSLCGNGIKEANEQCEGGECCSHRCRFYKANRPCGFRPAGSSPACVKKRRCNGLGVCRPAVIKQNPKKKCTTSAGIRGLCDIITGECK